MGLAFQPRRPIEAELKDIGIVRFLLGKERKAGTLQACHEAMNSISPYLKSLSMGDIDISPMHARLSQSLSIRLEMPLA